MQKSLSHKELLGKAIDIEHQGIAFYDIIALSANSEAAAGFFKSMVDKCHRHVDALQTLFDELSEDAGKQLVSDNDTGYLLSLTEELLSNEELIASRIADGIKSDFDALELAAYTKKNILLFYSKLLNALHDSNAKKVIQNILSEDEECFSSIKALEKELASA